MLLLTNQFHDLFEGLSVIWHKPIILCPTRGQYLSRCCRNLLIRRRLPQNSTVHRTCLALARELSSAKMEPKKPRALSIQQKFRFEISEIYEPNGSLHSGCIDPTQATARLVIVLVTRIQGSSTGNNNFVKWKETFRFYRPKWPDRWKRSTLKAGPECFGQTKSKRSIPFDVPTEDIEILGWMESASKKFFYTRISDKKNWKLYGCEIFQFEIGTLRSDEAMAAKTSLKKWIYVLSAFIAIIPTHFLYQK